VLNAKIHALGQGGQVVRGWGLEANDGRYKVVPPRAAKLTLSSSMSSQRLQRCGRSFFFYKPAF
jgi:hypothetical protein